MRARTIILRTAPYLLILLAVTAPCFNQYLTPATPPSGMQSFASEISSIHFDPSELPDKQPRTRAESAVLIDYKTGRLIYAKNPDEVRSIASISKLMTAMVVLDSKVDLSQTETISKEDARNSSKSHLRVGTTMTLEDLLHASLMQSDNRATRALSRAVAGTYEGFAYLMNRKADELQLAHTSFNEPTGLDSGNVSTALEVAKLLHAAYQYKKIAQITATRSFTCKPKNKPSRPITVHNTNVLIASSYNVLAGKTGYIKASEHCLTTLVQDRSGETIALVLLGAPSNRTRFAEARRLVKWGFAQIS